MRMSRLLWFICCILLGAAALAGVPHMDESKAQTVLQAQHKASGQAQRPAEGADAGASLMSEGASETNAASDTPLVKVLTVQGMINPASADFVTRGIREAAAQHAMLVVLQMDTPGGLDTSMRSIIQQILASPVPIATFVSPGGARAASAGAFILYASHIAAMTPASNLGAASPVSIGMSGHPDSPSRAQDQDSGKTGAEPTEQSQSPDTMTRKVTNDAAAYLRSLAQLRGRNTTFAQQAVLEARSLSSREALEGKVIDLIAKDVPDLLQHLDGREVTLDDGRLVTLHTANADIVYVAPGWRTRILALIANPQIALVLIMIGIYGLFFELTSPGIALPGVAGLISLLLGLYAFQLLPVNWAGLGLAVAGMAMMIGEVFLPSFGALGIGGIVAFVFGGMMLTNTGIPAYDLSIPFLAGVAVAAALLIMLTGVMATRAHKRAVVSGREGMNGRIGVVTSVTQGTVYAEISGESWRVRADRQLAPGDTVQVLGMDGLTLQVALLSTSTMDRESTRGF